MRRPKFIKKKSKTHNNWIKQVPNVLKFNRRKFCTVVSCIIFYISLITSFVVTWHRTSKTLQQGGAFQSNSCQSRTIPLQIDGQSKNDIFFFAFTHEIILVFFFSFNEWWAVVMCIVHQMSAFSTKINI